MNTPTHTHTHTFALLPLPGQTAGQSGQIENVRTSRNELPSKMSPHCWENAFSGTFGSHFSGCLTLKWFQQECDDDVISVSASSHGARAHLIHLQTSEEEKAIILSVTGE